MEFNQNKNPLRPYQSKYSEDQQKVMSKIANIGAATRNIKSLLNLKKIASKNTEKNTVSLFDYAVELLNMLLGPQYTDGLFMKFLNELMDPEKTYLEEFLIKALAKSLDANGKHLAPIGDVQTDKLFLNSIAITSITLSDGINEPEVFFEGDTLTYDTTARIAERMVYLINNEKEKVTVSASQDNPGVDEYFNLKSQIAGTGYTKVNLVNLTTDPVLDAQNVQMQQQVINNNNATLVYNYTYLEGRVINTLNNNPIPSALIVIRKSAIPDLSQVQNSILQNESLTVKTDNEGLFKVQNLEVNKYDIFTYCDNYKDNSILNFQLSNDDLNNLEIKLETGNTNLNTSSVNYGSTLGVEYSFAFDTFSNSILTTINNNQANINLWN
jgi:hypothetical protein